MAAAARIVIERREHRERDAAAKLSPVSSAHGRRKADYDSSLKAEVRRLGTLRGTLHFIHKTGSTETGALPFQFEVARFYARDKVQIVVAGLIFGNFIVSAAAAQFPAAVGSAGEKVYFGFEVFFNVCFTVELIGNLYANFFCQFWRSAWNVFDFVIVIISIVSMVASNLPGVGVLRLFRAFRVFRLFKRIKSLKIIIEGVVRSLPGVFNAFAVLLLIMSIWAIMAVNFWKDDHPNEFGNFGLSLLTFFQIMTYDAWCSGVARELIMEAEGQAVIVAFFFLMYVFINSIMMTNVVVAILLEKFIAAIEELSSEGPAPSRDDSCTSLESCTSTDSWLEEASSFQSNVLSQLQDFGQELSANEDVLASLARSRPGPDPPQVDELPPGMIADKSQGLPSGYVTFERCSRPKALQEEHEEFARSLSEQFK